MKFNINNYKGKYVMHCKTEDEAREFCDYVERFGVSYSVPQTFRDFDVNTCYNFNFGRYSDKDYYKSNGYTILEWSDFNQNEFTKADLKDGMVVECANGNKFLVLGDNLIETYGYLELKNYSDDLTFTKSEPCKWNINKVYKVEAYSLDDIFNDDLLTLIWERNAKPEPIEMTLEEVCKALGKEIKIVKG